MKIKVMENRIAFIDVDTTGFDDELGEGANMIYEAYKNGAIEFDPSRCHKSLEVYYPGEGFGFDVEAPDNPQEAFLGIIDENGDFYLS